MLGLIQICVDAQPIESFADMAAFWATIFSSCEQMVVTLQQIEPGSMLQCKNVDAR